MCMWLEVRNVLSLRVLILDSLNLLWLLFAAGIFKPKIRIPLAAQLLLVIQVWLMVSAVVANLTLGREIGLDTIFYLPLLYFMSFAIPAILVSLVGEARQILTWLVYGVIFISSAIAVAEFFHVPFAMRIFAMYFSVQVAMGDEALSASGIRASGLSIGSAVLSQQALACFALIAMQLRTRKLTMIEWVIGIIFLLSVFMGQVRTIVVALVLILVYVGYLLVRRYKAKGGLLTGLGVVGILGMMRFFNFGYLTADFLKDQTMKWRYTTVWPQALECYRALPWTGIGPEQGFSHVSMMNMIAPRDRYMSTGTMDGSYHTILATSGLIGCLLWGTIGALLVVGLLAIIRSPIESGERKNYAAGLLTVVSMLLLLLYTFSNLYWREAMVPLLIAFGAMTRTPEEQSEYVRQRMKTGFTSMPRKVSTKAIEPFVG